jgi:hypothetical protein
MNRPKSPAAQAAQTARQEKFRRQLEREQRDKAEIDEITAQALADVPAELWQLDPQAAQEFAVARAQELTRERVWGRASAHYARKAAERTATQEMSSPSPSAEAQPADPAAETEE